MNDHFSKGAIIALALGRMFQEQHTIIRQNTLLTRGKKHAGNKTATAPTGMNNRKNVQG